MRISQMAYRRLLLSIVVILLALGCCTAECCQGYIGRELKGPNDPKFLGCFGRKLLRGKAVDIEGKTKPADLDKPFTFPQTESENVVYNSAKHDSDTTEKNKGSSNAFREADEEVANLMRRDYKGADRPKRNPPVNNHEPKG